MICERFKTQVLVNTRIVKFSAFVLLTFDRFDNLKIVYPS